MYFSDTNCYLNIVFNENNHNILTKTPLIDDKNFIISNYGTPSKSGRRTGCHNYNEYGICQVPILGNIKKCRKKCNVVRKWTIYQYLEYQLLAVLFWLFDSFGLTTNEPYTIMLCPSCVVIVVGISIDIGIICAQLF